MSTADSLILSCAANLSEDFVPRERLPLFLVKSATVTVTVLALVIALFGDQSVFSLVIGAWGVMAAAFAPLLTVYALGGRVSEALAIAMLVVGVATVYAWQSVALLADYYAGMPAILLGFGVYGLGRLLGFAESAERDDASEGAAEEPA
jgi:Na+/proline symporter